MKYVISGTAAALLLSAGVCGAAMAQTAPAAPSSTPASSTPAKADPGDRVICKYVDPDTGSLLNTRHKVCHTKREWDQMNKDAADLINSNGREPGRPK